VAAPERPGVRRLQRGAALLVLLAVLVLGASWFLVSRLDALSAGIFTASHRNHNALVLSQAKQALIGYVAMNAAQSGENNPGRFPCRKALLLSAPARKASRRPTSVRPTRRPARRSVDCLGARWGSTNSSTRRRSRFGMWYLPAGSW